MVEPVLRLVRSIHNTFPADALTASLIPDAATNAWTISLSEDGQQITYFLERDNKPRFKAILTAQKD